MTTSAIGLSVGATLQASIANADSLLEWHELRAAPEADPAWLPWADLMRDGAAELDRWLPAIGSSLTAPPETAASYLLGWCAGAVAAATATLYVADRRVPTLDPDALWLRRTPGHWVDATALDITALDGTALAAGMAAVTVLPDDPLTGRPGVDIAATVEDLRRVLVAGFVAHLSPLVEAVRRRSRLGRRVCWGLVADSLAETILEASRGLGRPVSGRDEADAVFAAAVGLLDPGRRWVTLHHGERDHVFACRSACCLAYKTPEGQYCVTCPSTPDPERIQRLLAHLDGQPPPVINPSAPQES